MRSPRLARFALVIAVALATASCGSDEDAMPPPVDDTEVPGPDPTPTVSVTTLNQGWDDQTRQNFWFTTQGSQIVRYEYFLALQQTDGSGPFASPDNLASYNYLPAQASSMNPDGLPIGFVKHIESGTGDPYFGFTCAACHTSQINYNGTGIFIDGAGTLADFNTFMNDLVDALDATTQNTTRFSTFANAVLGPNHTQMQADQLLTDLEQATLELAERLVRNTPPSPAGFARLDAFGNIFNELMVVSLGVPANQKAPNAPVSYPFLWTTGQLDLVQWNGAAPNAGLIGPLARNIGEVIGVFGHLQIIPDSIFTGYPSTIEVENLGEIEAWINDLLSPQWPNNVLPPIDPVKAAEGQALYNQSCASCHQVIDRTNTDLEISVVMVPQTQIQTDPTMTVNAATRMGMTDGLDGTLELILLGDTFGPTAAAGDLLANGVIGVLLNHPFEGLEAAIEEYHEDRNAMMFNPESYKARPLNGIWATAPYLHNGSVPNLAQLLLSPSQRVAQFYVGSREFDPVNVGFITTQTPGAYLFDTTVAGNSNAGHDYGTGALTAQQRLELVEYLKTL